MDKKRKFIQQSLPLLLCLPIAAQAALEEVIVTAQKTMESVQDVPIAISAFTDKGLQEAGIRSSDELSVVTPGLQFGRQLTNATPFIRGVGTQNTSNGDESSIATYVDGVYYADFTAAVQNFNNLERVEVLKGPQGTLFGRNATGGLIHYITKDPLHDPAAKIRLTYGNYETYSASVYGTAGVTDDLAADIAIYSEEQGEGYGDNLLTGEETNKGRVSAVRSKWLYTPSEVTTITAAFDYAETTGSTAMAFSIAPGAVGFGGFTKVGDWWDIYSNLSPKADNNNWGAAITIDHDFDELNLVSITAYRSNDLVQLIDQDGTPLPVVDAELTSYTKTLSQEFRLSSDTGDDLTWMVGLFLYDADAAFDPFVASGLAFMLNPQLGPLGVVSQVQNVEQDTRSYAVFGQGTYALSDELKLTLGLRYTYDKREIDATGGFFAGPLGSGAQLIPLPNLKDDENWGELTWRTALDYQIDEDTLIYASYSRGFKSGVYNSINPGNPPVDPETLDAFEVGVKADLLDNTLRWNTAVFYYKYDDLQLQRLEGGVTQLLNAAKVNSYGLDSSLDYALTDNLTINAGLALLHATFDEFPDAPYLVPNPNFPYGNAPGGDGPQGNADVKDNDVIRSPRWTGSLGVIYHADTAYGGLDASLYYYYNDGFYWEPDNRFEQDAYSTVNGSVSWALPGDRWTLGLWGRNLTEEEYSYFSTGSSLGDIYTAAPPRTYGVSVEYKTN